MSEHPGLPPQTPQGTGLPGISNPIYTFPDKTSSHTKATTAAILAIIIGSSRFTEILKDFSISMTTLFLDSTAIGSFQLLLVTLHLCIPLSLLITGLHFLKGKGRSRLITISIANLIITPTRIVGSIVLLNEYETRSNPFYVTEFTLAIVISFVFLALTIWLIILLFSPEVRNRRF